MQTPVVTMSSTVYIASQYSVSRNLLHIFPSFHLQNDPALPMDSTLASYFWQEAIALIGYHPRLECSLSVLLLCILLE